MVSNLRRVAEQKARKYGLDPTLFSRQIGAESRFQPHVVSGAGARGVAQIMPGTAAAWHVNPDKPVQALDAAAKHMADYVKKGGSYRNALVLYNLGHLAPDSQLPAETRNYIAKITGGKAGQTRLGKPERGQTFQFQDVQIGSKAVTDQAGLQQAQQDYALDRLLTAGHGPRGTVMQRVGLLRDTAPTAGEFTTTKQTSKIVNGDKLTIPGDSPTGGGGKRGKVSVAPGANRAGVNLKPVVTDFASIVAADAGMPLRLTTGSNHNRLTVDGNVSDHWDGHAGDFAASGATLTHMGRAALIAAGMPRAQAMKVKGGLFNLQWRGRRVQVIFNTNEGGNHFNHLHLGVR